MSLIEISSRLERGHAGVLRDSAPCPKCGRNVAQHTLVASHVFVLCSVMYDVQLSHRRLNQWVPVWWFCESTGTRMQS